MRAEHMISKHATLNPLPRIDRPRCMGWAPSIAQPSAPPLRFLFVHTGLPNAEMDALSTLQDQIAQCGLHACASMASPLAQPPPIVQGRQAVKAISVKITLLPLRQPFEGSCNSARPLRLFSHTSLCIHAPLPMHIVHYIECIAHS